MAKHLSRNYPLSKISQGIADFLMKGEPVKGYPHTHTEIFSLGNQSLLLTYEDVGGKGTKEPDPWAKLEMQTSYPGKEGWKFRTEEYGLSGIASLYIIDLFGRFNVAQITRVLDRSENLRQSSGRKVVMPFTHPLDDEVQKEYRALTKEVLKFIYQDNPDYLRLREKAKK